MDGLGLRQARDAAGFAVGLIVLTASVVMLYTGMRDVMVVGGSCGSGGPYVIATPCPQGTGGLMVGGIFGWFIGSGVVALFGSRLGGAYVGWAALGWPALFLSLGWNFWEYGRDPVTGADTDVGLVVCAVVFWLMGGIPLVVAAKGLRHVVWPAADSTPPGGKAREGWRDPDRQPANRLRRQVTATATSTATAPARAGRMRRPTTAPGIEVTFVEAGGTPVASTPEDRPTPQDAPVDPETGAALKGAKAAKAKAAKAPTSPKVMSSRATGGLVADLERLAGLRASGAIDDGEYERAKDVVLGRAEEDA